MYHNMTIDENISQYDTLDCKKFLLPGKEPLEQKRPPKKKHCQQSTMPYREFIDVFVLINKSQQTPDKDENDWDENSWRCFE